MFGAGGDHSEGMDEIVCFSQHRETRKMVQKNGNCSRLVVASSFEFVYSFAFLVFRSVMLSQRSTLYIP